MSTEAIPAAAHQHNDECGTITFCWKLNLRARLRLLITGRLWHQVMTFYRPLQPQLMLVEKPEMKKPQ